MMLIELFVPRGARTPGNERRRVAERLLAELTSHEGADPAVLDATRALFHVIVHEPHEWISGGGRVEPPRYFVRVSLPGGSMVNDKGRAHYISAITRVLAETSDQPERFYREPVATVHLIEVPEGAYGSLGRPMREADLVQMVMGTGGGTVESARSVQPGADTAVDPICGITVQVTDTAIVLEHDRGTYAFCCNGCRDVFAERHAGSSIR